MSTTYLKGAPDGGGISLIYYRGNKATPTRRVDGTPIGALDQALAAAPCQIGLCIVGIEPRETPKTLPGVMVEAYVRNARQRKSFFIRYGAGSPRGFPAAIRLSAEMLVSQTQSRRTALDRAQTR